VASPSPHFIVAAPGGPTSLRNSALVRTMVGVMEPLTGADAVMGATVQPTGVGAVVGATVQLGAMDITAGAARSLGARTVCASPLTLLLALILTTSLCPSRGTMLLCVRLSKPTARPPTSSVLQSPLSRARILWSLLPLSAASSWLVSPIAISSSSSQALMTTTSMRRRRSTLTTTAASSAPTQQL
jgi:hypothetical protein